MQVPGSRAYQLPTGGTPPAAAIGPGGLAASTPSSSTPSSRAASTAGSSLSGRRVSTPSPSPSPQASPGSYPGSSPGAPPAASLGTALPVTLPVTLPPQAADTPAPTPPPLASRQGQALSADKRWVQVGRDKASLARGLNAMTLLATGSNRMTSDEELRRNAVRLLGQCNGMTVREVTQQIHAMRRGAELNAVFDGELRTRGNLLGPGPSASYRVLDELRKGLAIVQAEHAALKADPARFQVDKGHVKPGSAEFKALQQLDRAAIPRAAKALATIAQAMASFGGE